MEPQAPIEKTEETAPQIPVNLEARLPGVGQDGRLLLLQQALQATLARAHDAQTAAAMQQAVARAHQLQLDISNIQQQNYNRAIALLLLDAF